MPRPQPAHLAKLALFGGLSPASLEAFAERAEVLALAAGDVVFREGDVAKTLYVVESGELHCVKDGPGGRVPLSLLQPGECFGEMSFIDMQPRSATICARTSAVVWSWPYSVLHERYCSDSKAYTLLIMNIARELSRRLRRADELIARV